MSVVGEGRWLFYGKVSGESSFTQKKEPVRVCSDRPPVWKQEI